jgi:UDP-glucose 4-epimerase
MRSILGITPDAGTVDVIDGLYRWPSIVRRPAQRQVA